KVQYLLNEDKSKDEFEVGKALAVFQRALKSGMKTDLTDLLNAHLTLLNSLDALETKLQKDRGDTDDILQMVRWQEQIYAGHPKLPNQNRSAYVVKESKNFIRAWDTRKSDSDAY